MSTPLLRGGGGSDGGAPPAPPPVPPGDHPPPPGKGSKREFVFVVAGYNTCGYFQKASKLVAALTLLYPDGRVRHEEQNFATRDEYKAWLGTHKLEPKLASDARAQAHGSSPFVTLNGTFLGGCDDTIAFCRATFGAGSSSSSSSSSGNGVDGGDEDEGVVHVPDGFDTDHPYDYDLVVIGGGSGGLACAKEAAGLGARVALLDYVKPSPAGTSWGLGGTCVNVGCIPKKLCHQAALLGEAMAADSSVFGWTIPADETEEAPPPPPPPQQQQQKKPKHHHHYHSWETLRENVQAHIRSLNFNYRVALRDGRVTYLNQHGRFFDAHTLEVVDKEGQTRYVSGARFVVAVGGRPQPLECPGGELAISSDDLFNLPKAPGKTCVIGAGYVALECAGFLKGLGEEGKEEGEVTVVVRSILLRGSGFDRECVDRVGEHLEGRCGVRLLKGMVPVEVSRVVDEEGGREGGRLRVAFSNGLQEVFDTVLAARGRYADLASLDVAKVGLALDAGTGKLLCQEEQTNVAHVYAVGDVVHGGPELTPVAIQAGRLLARRLFGGSGVGMDYRAVATTVFTPLEYACVGLSEEEAREEVGEEGVEVFVSEFTPLEWAMVPRRVGGREGGGGFAKAVVRKSDGRVLGLHYVGPHAGEVMQGYAVAMKGGREGGRGLTHAQLIGTVGIHPTSAEELTMLTVSKGSGAPAKKAGC